jgi:hypothetical protein
MSDVCKDGNDSILRNSSVIIADRFSSIENLESFFQPEQQLSDDVSVEPYINATGYESTDGLINRSQIDALYSEFEREVVAKDQTSLERSISLFGKTAFEGSVKEVNLFLLKKLRPQDFGTTAVETFNFNDYPSLNSRIKRGTSITPIEVSEFITLNYLTPNLLARNIDQKPNTILKQLDNYYNQNFSQSSMGSFCALAPSIFGAVSGFFTSVGEVAALIDNVIGQILNFSLAGLVNNLRKQIIQVVDKAIENVKNIVQNFNISNMVSQVQTFVNDNVVTRALEIKDQVMSFFSEENIRALRDRINSLIGYAINLFNNPTLEEVQFLIYRFCSFIQQVESSLLQVKAPLDDYSSNFEVAYKKVSASSNINTVRAVQSGALRFDTQTRGTRISEIQTATSAPRTTNPRPISQTDVDGVTPWNNGRGDSRIRFGGGIQPGRMGEEGWTRVSPQARSYIMRVQAKFGRQLQVNSGYRSPEYNSRIGGATRSKHMDGTALDVTWSGFDEQTKRQFIEMAQEEGFLGIGVYSSFIHVDLGPRRRWGG